MVIINSSEFDKTLKKYQTLKNEELGILDSINKSIADLSLYYRTGVSLDNVNSKINNKISNVKLLHENSQMYLQNIYDDYMSAFNESSSIMGGIDGSGGVK